MGGCCTKDSSTDTVRSKARRYEQQQPRQQQQQQPRGILVSRATAETPADSGYSRYREPSHGGRRRQRKQYVNINTADEHELAALGLSQSQSRGIVAYRTTRGQYYHVNDLLNVPGITQQTLDNIRHDITIGEIIREPRNRANPSVGINKSSSSLRLATWNMQDFTEHKANNSTVLEIICLTILRHDIDIIAFQEIGSPSAIEKVCKELNQPRISSVRAAGRGKQWSYVVSSEATGRMHQSLEYSGYLWNSSQSIELVRSNLLDWRPTKHDDRFVRKPFFAYFKVRGWVFVLISVHLKATGLNNEDIDQLKIEIKLLPSVLQTVEKQGYNDIILVGDFNMDSADNSFNPLHNKNYTNALPTNVPTNISARNAHGRNQYDNMWLSHHVGKKYHQQWVVVREGLTLPNKEETVSDHCPVLIDLKIK